MKKFARSLEYVWSSNRNNIIFQEIKISSYSFTAIVLVNNLLSTHPFVNILNIEPYQIVSCWLYLLFSMYLKWPSFSFFPFLEYGLWMSNPLMNISSSAYSLSCSSAFASSLRNPSLTWVWFLHFFPNLTWATSLQRIIYWILK